MKLIDAGLGCRIIEPQVFGDSRGVFFESWNRRRWAEQGLALYANDHSLLNICGVVYSYTAEHEKARQVYLQVLGMSGLSTELKYIAMNNVAYANLQLEDFSLLAQADEYSEQAFKNVPWHPSLMGTRGAVLVELGQVDVGIELLRMALKKTTNAQNKAQHACAIALGELKRGRLLHAQKYLEAARQFDSKCLQLELVVRKLAVAKQ